MTLPGTTQAESLDLTARSSGAGHQWRQVLRGLIQVVLTLAVILVFWVVFLKAAGLSPLVGRGPGDVWAYLVSGPGAGANLHSVMDGLAVTLGDAGLGFAAGLVVGVVVAVTFTLSRTLAQTFLPVALLLRSVPFVAMTPVIVLVFGRGYVAVTVISGLVVFFPTLINVLFGLRSAPAGSIDLVRAYGGGTGEIMRRVSLPSCLPALFASARIGVPGAFIGSLLAEWLDTGKGLGWRMLQDGTTFQYNDLWASVVALTVACTLLYIAIGVVQSSVLARFGPAAGVNR
jgi:ABC-type nitrate/sulfonate/bicarbonate transport system permease component